MTSSRFAHWVVSTVGAVATVVFAGCNDGARRPSEPAAPPIPASSSRPFESPDSRSVADTRRTSPDVPLGSQDAITDGLTAVVREMVRKGLDDNEAALAERLRLIFDVSDVGGQDARVREAHAMAKVFLGIRRHHGPKDGVDPNRTLSEAEELRVRTLGRTLALDTRAQLLRKWKPPTPAPVVRDPPPGCEAVTWRTLGDFAYLEGMTLPDDVRRLHGKKIAIAGFIFTLDEVENIRRFLLVEAHWSSTHGVVPNVNQVIDVRIEGLAGVEYSESPIMIAGTLDIGEVVEEGFVTSVYRVKLDGPAQVKPIE